MSAMRQYVNANPCDPVRAAALDKLEANPQDTEARQIIDYFLYSLCEQCCDCVPMGANDEFFSQYQAAHSSSDPALYDPARGNCPAHAYYDVCKVLPKVTSFHKIGQAPKSGMPPACPLLNKWFEQPGSKNWQNDPQTDISPGLRAFLLNMLDVHECAKKQIWDVCYDLEEKQKHLGVPEDQPSVIDDTGTELSPPASPSNKPPGSSTDSYHSSTVVPPTNPPTSPPTTITTNPNPSYDSTSSISPSLTSPTSSSDEPSSAPELEIESDSSQNSAEPSSTDSSSGGVADSVPPATGGGSGSGDSGGSSGTTDSSGSSGSSGSTGTTTPGSSGSISEDGTPIPASTPSTDDPGAGASSEPQPRECFPSDATVELIDGSVRRMDNLRIGDIVLVDGGRWEPVYLFSHSDVSARSEYVVVMTSSGHSVEMTGGHMIQVNGQLTEARMLKRGDTVSTVDGVATVRNVAKVRKSGLFNPHTASGSIVVNGVVCSTFTRAVQESMANALLAPIRALFRAGGITHANAGWVLQSGVGAESLNF